jgi:hypothetical protein
MVDKAKPEKGPPAPTGTWPRKTLISKENNKESYGDNNALSFVLDDPQKTSFLWMLCKPALTFTIFARF